ncbi:MAG: DNA repair protein RecO [Clostridiales bacterium]|jgi:DNA repair protein RecO (recombination protein O)|nr:DNA repair protein RecO [Clostridiales bacterium]
MNLVRTQGVVLRYENRREADRLLTVLSPDLGRILVYARGCRKQSSRFLAFSQLFCYGEIIIKPYRDIYILNQAEVKNSYFNIRNDVDRLACATYAANLAEAAATTGESNAGLFALVLQALSYLSYSDHHPLKIVLIYELKLLERIGYRPLVESQAVSGIPVHPQTAGAVKRILDSEPVQAADIQMCPMVRQELNRILPLIIEDKLELKINSRSFLNLIT